MRAKDCLTLGGGPDTFVELVEDDSVLSQYLNYIHLLNSCCKQGRIGMEKQRKEKEGGEEGREGKKRCQSMPYIFQPE